MDKDNEHILVRLAPSLMWVSLKILCKVNEHVHLTPHSVVTLDSLLYARARPKLCPDKD